MLALGDAEDDFDVDMLEGRAELLDRPTSELLDRPTSELLDRPTSELLPPGHMAKYARRLAAIGLTAGEYAATYSQVLRIVPVRLLGWHGREMPRSARLAGAPAVSIDEPCARQPSMVSRWRECGDYSEWAPARCGRRVAPGSGRRVAPGMSHRRPAASPRRYRPH